MKNVIKTILVTTLLSLGLGFIVPTTTVFADDVCSTNAPDEVKRAAGCFGSSDQLVTTIQGIINAIVLILGTVAVIFIIIGGVKYMTSAGDANKTKQAKETILYAVIGLIICALAALIVNFVITIINQNT